MSEETQRHIEQAVVKALGLHLEPAIKIILNGKIDEIQRQMRGQNMILEDINKKLDDLKPVIEAKKTIVSARKFIVWIATPAAVMWGIVKYLIK